MANTYNPYSDIQSVYNAKVAWNKATTDEERKRQNEIATAARKNLEAYGYGDVANQISASGVDATAVRKILDSYSPTAPYSTTLSNNELITKNNNETRNKINQLWGTQTTDRETIAGKYDKLEETAYSNPFTTDEAKAILSKFDLSGLKARDNAVASGGSSNGGNIDSNAAANALRQQAALVNQGQKTVLDAHNNKINNVKGILESLGVYQQNQDKGMQTTIGLQSNEGQRLFENDLTEKATIAEVTGYTPTEWTIKNDDVYSTYLNADGTFKKEMENVDIQALINSAKASGDTDTAKKLAVVRAKKILSNYGEFGKYANEGDISYMSQQQTEAGRQFDKQDATTRESLKTEQNIAASNNATEQAIANAANQNALDQIIAQTQGQKEIISETAKYGNIEVDKNGNVKVKETDDEDDEDEYPAYTNWNDAGITLQNVTISKPDDATFSSNVTSSGVDENGKKAINSVYSAVANGTLDQDKDGIVTNYELADYLITHSNDNDTDKKQLKKVFAYFGLTTSLLDNVQDVGKGKNLSGSDYKYGVEYTS